MACVSPPSLDRVTEPARAGPPWSEVNIAGGGRGFKGESRRATKCPHKRGTGGEKGTEARPPRHAGTKGEAWEGPLLPHQRVHHSLHALAGSKTTRGTWSRGSRRAAREGECLTVPLSRAQVGWMGQWDSGTVKMGGMERMGGSGSRDRRPPDGSAFLMRKRRGGGWGGSCHLRVGVATTPVAASSDGGVGPGVAGLP